MLIQINGVVRIATEIESRFTDSGMQIASFSVVGDEKYKDKQTTCFIDCTAFSGLAKIITDYCQKGSQIYIQGKIKQDSWVTADGSKRSKHSITLDNIQMLGSKEHATPKEGVAKPEIVHETAPREVAGIDIDIDQDIPFAPIGLQYKYEAFLR